MFQLIDDFRVCDDNRQPYSFLTERHTATENLHAWVRDGAFCLASIGNRHILAAPAFSHGTFEMWFHFTYMQEFDPSFTVFFHYDRATRKGRGLRFTYSLRGTVTAELLDADKTAMTVLETRLLTLPQPLDEEHFVPFRLTLTGSTAEGSFAGADFSFPIVPGKGSLAIQRYNFIGEMALDRIAFHSDDAFPREILVPEVTAQVPCFNGGDIPYTVSWSVERIAGDAYLMARLDGGTKTRPVNREDRPGQYVAQQDRMTGPYVGITDGTHRAVFPLGLGEQCFIDPNIYWDCQKGFFGDVDLPLKATCLLPEALLGADTRFFFGYENLLCTGYAAQEGGCEFRYTSDGALLDFGPPSDGRDMYDLFSQEQKLAHSFVPQDIWHRQEVLDHLTYNHYFDVSEEIRFTMEMKTQTDPDYLSFRATVLNVFETLAVGEYPVSVELDTWDFGYNRLRCSVKIPPVPLGVWKVEFRVFFGGEEYHRFVKAFEVYDKDSDQNPALAAGLPFVFSMPNEQKWLARNSFDFWNPARSCDLEHYITCITETPHEAELRQSWRMLKAFKRQWFAWVSSRTCRPWQLEDHPEVVKNADYLFPSWNEKVMDLSQSGLYPVRQDHFAYDNFMMRKEVRVGILDDFLRKNPRFAENLAYRPGVEFTQACYMELMSKYGRQWTQYQNERGMEILRAFNKELKGLNPNFKRAIYGPINSYTLPTLTSHALKAFGFPDGESLVRDCFTGFCVFEDYPFACAYPTYRGPFIAMQILLEAPGLVLYPEQYKGGRGGCIDGAVKFGHAPMGAYSVEPYQNSTHAFEFVFNTPHLRPDGFHYWNTYGFHRSDYPEAFMDKLIRDWHYVVENKPARPLRTMAYLAQYSDLDDEFTVFVESSDVAGTYIINPTEAGHGLIHDCSREAGLPNGFALKYEALDALTPEDCTLLVLPNLAHATDSQRQRIRRLHENGVNLVALARVDGLEDLFGVEPWEQETEINTLLYGGEQEYVRGIPTVLPYRAAGAQVIAASGTGAPLAFRTERTLLLNTSVTNLGCADSPTTIHAVMPHIVGILVRRLLREQLTALAQPLARGLDHVGVTLFETEGGKRMLLAIDYTPFDNREKGQKQAVVQLNMPDVIGAVCDRKLMVGKKNGTVRELRFEIAPRESVFIELL